LPLYPLARKLLFRFEPETAHDLAFGLLDRIGPLAGATAWPTPPKAPTQWMGVAVRNPVGLAAGLDKNGDHIDTLARLGFGFLEIGTVTPRAQPGNPKPRMFRLPEHEALINRLGFNNHGLEALVRNVRASRYAHDGNALGINIGKNFDTPNERAHEDYLVCLEAVYPLASYVTVNISSPNTKNLRELQKGDALSDLLRLLAKSRDRLARKHKRRVPIALKIAPDLTRKDVGTMMATVLDHEFDGVIATNTTIKRPVVEGHRLATEAGGLSGAPLAESADQVLGWVVAAVDGKIPVLGVGGITSGAHARHKIEIGAQAVQIYTGFIYHGPALIRECVKAIAAISRASHGMDGQRE
jgi:dihydroorotate dehydrogenase